MGADDNHYDIIIIGGGSAGYAAARTALQYTKKVAVIDGSDELGGLCILKGCMPSKTLLYTAEIAHAAQKGAELGLTAKKIKVDVAKLQERKKRLIGEFAAYRKGQLESGNFALYRSNAHFLDHLTVKLDDGTELWADKFIISTGSKVNVPSIKGLDQVGSLTSDDILSLSTLPPSMIVLGGGIVACELAQYMNRAGVKVTMIQRSLFLLKEMSQEASLVVQTALEDEGIAIHTGTTIEEVSRNGESTVVHFKKDEVSFFAVADGLFNAMGRSPNTATLELENADVQLAPSGHIETNSYQQSTNPAVYAAGDCAGPNEIVHIAIMQGENAAHHALGSKTKEIDYDHVLKVVFTDPQIAIVGLSKREIEARGIDCEAASFPFFDHGKSMVMDAMYGYVKVFARRSDRVILGAECVGKDASELIHTLSVAVATSQTVEAMLRVHWYHPTLSEIWTYPLEDLQESLA